MYTYFIAKELRESQASAQSMQLAKWVRREKERKEKTLTMVKREMFVNRLEINRIR